MKTTLLLSAVLLFGGVSFAQTNVKSNTAIKSQSNVENNSATGNVNASTAGSIQSNAVSKASQRSSVEIKKEQKSMVAEKQSTQAKVNGKGTQISSMASEENNTKIEANEKGKLISAVASDGKSGAASSHAHVTTQANANADATVQNNTEVKPKVHAVVSKGKKIKTTSATTIHTAATSAPSVKIHPVSVKTRTSAGVGIRIK